MIIWQGYGFAIPLIAFLGFFGGLIFAAVFETNNSWPMVIGLLLGAAANYFIAKKLDSKGKTLIDPTHGNT